MKLAKNKLRTSEIAEMLGCSKRHARWLAVKKFKSERLKDSYGRDYLVVDEKEVIDYSDKEQTVGFPRGRKRKTEDQ